MKIRADIADMIRAGATTTAIKATLHVGYGTVTNARKALGIPAPTLCGRPLLPIPGLFHARTEPVDGGHLRWTGYVSNGVPTLGRRGRPHSAYRIAFEIRYGRKPVGLVRSTCGYPQCVAPDHMQDRPMRDRLNAQYAAIFGDTG